MRKKQTLSGEHMIKLLIRKNELLEQKNNDLLEMNALADIAIDGMKNAEKQPKKRDNDPFDERAFRLLRREIKSLKSSNAALKRNNRELRLEIKRMKKTLSWKVTAPLRAIRSFAKIIVSFCKKIAVLFKMIHPAGIKKFFVSIRTIGWKRTICVVLYHFRSKANHAYLTWMKYNDPTEKELQKQRQTNFSYQPKISILVPMYKTPIPFFEELVEYMIGQTYGNWELCLEDGSPEKNERIEEICKKDDRIKYRYTGNNLGIAGNTNEALKRATGDYIALLDHDDLLPQNCLYEIVKAVNEDADIEFIYTDEDKITTTDKPRFDPHFKPDFAIDTLRTINYICHFSVFRRDLMEKLGGERSEYDGAQDYDLIIRMAEIATHIKHIPKILYHWRVHELSTAKAGDAKPYAFEAGIKVLQDHLARVGLEGTVSHGATLGSYIVSYRVKDNPKVSILIPNCNQPNTLKVCVDSVLNKTTYDNYEIVVIENNSTDELVFEYYKELEQNDKIAVLRYPEKGFNYSRIINFGVRNTSGDYIVQLNNDTELITPDWIEKMLGFCQREDVGCVGVKLYYPDQTIQHAGVVLGLGGVAGHVFRGLNKDLHGYFARESWIQNVSIVTAACMMASRKTYEQVGLMEEKLAVAFNDVDFCMKVLKSGKLNVYHPFVELIHYESKSRGNDSDPDKIERFHSEIAFFMNKWKKELEAGDPYYNINLRLDNDQYEIQTKKVIYAANAKRV